MYAIALAVGRPLRVAVVRAGRVREVARHAVARGHGEDVAACAEQRALAVVRNLEGRDVLAHVGQRRACTEPVFQNLHRHLLGLSALHIEAVDVAAVLEDDRVLARGRELDVELGEVGVPRHLLRRGIDGVQVEPLLLAAIHLKY